MSLIRSKNQLIHIPLYYMEKKMTNEWVKIVIISEEKAKEMMEDESKKNLVLCLNTHWALLNWGDQNNITKNAIFTTPEGYRDVDMIKVRDMRLKTALKEWDLVDDAGNKQPVSQATIDALPPEVVTALIREYEKRTSLSEEEEKNS
jgi:hypothetical protein